MLSELYVAQITAKTRPSVPPQPRCNLTHRHTRAEKHRSDSSERGRAPRTGVADGRPRRGATVGGEGKAGCSACSAQPGDAHFHLVAGGVRARVDALHGWHVQVVATAADQDVGLARGGEVGRVEPVPGAVPPFDPE